MFVSSLYQFLLLLRSERKNLSLIKNNNYYSLLDCSTITVGVGLETLVEDSICIIMKDSNLNNCPIRMYRHPDTLSQSYSCIIGQLSPSANVVFLTVWTNTKKKTCGIYYHCNIILTVNQGHPVEWGEICCVCIMSITKVCTHNSYIFMGNSFKLCTHNSYIFKGNSFKLCMFAYYHMGNHILLGILIGPFLIRDNIMW